jgi:membrane protein YqaA with SNARE-associated domain
MIYLLVLLLVIPSPIFIVFNSEVIAVVLGLKGHPFWLVALCLATGQTIGFSLLYLLSLASIGKETRLF